MANKLNKRQQAYCYYRARDYTIEQAMSKAGYTCKGDIARSVGSHLEQNSNITQEIERERLNIFDVKKIDLEYLTEKANEIAQNSKQDANKLRALEILAKLKGLWVDKAQIDTHEVANEEESMLEEYIKQASKHNRIEGMLE